MSKRAYLKACLNVALQTGKDKETAATMAKQAAAWREKRFSPEVMQIQEKRASQLKKLILERKDATA